MKKLLVVKLPRQRGVGLLEILIAVVVLSIGFLAAARMQMQGMRFSQAAYHQSQAYFMASDIIDRMRSNPEGVSDGKYDAVTTVSGLTAANCASGYCTPAQIASKDIAEWSAFLHAPDNQKTTFQPTLPGSTTNPAKGEVKRLADGVFSITLTWSEQIGNTDALQSLSVNFAPQTT